MTDLFGRLNASYPQLRRFMGEDAFQRAALIHIDLEEPHVRSLDTFTAHFSETLRGAHPHSPHLHELTWIEYVLGSPCFADPDAPGEDCDGDVWGTLPLQFSSTLLTRELTTNAVAIWQAQLAGAPRPEPALLSQPCKVMAWRAGETAGLRTICGLEHDAVLHVQANRSFTSLRDMLADRLGKQAATEQASALLAAWTSQKLLSQRQGWEF